MTSTALIPEKYEPYLRKGLPIVVYLLGLWYFCFRILGFGLEYIPGDLGDARFINFLLEHGYKHAGSTTDFWSAGFMYPFQNSIALSDNMLGTMPFYAFWRFFGVGQETSYQLWWMVICSLNYWSAYFVIKRWFNRWDLAILVAWIFAFTIFNMGQLNYMQMIIRFMVPVVMYAGAKMIDTSSPKYFAIFSLGIVYQFYCVIYTGFFLMYFSVFFVIIYAIITKKYLFFVPLFKGKSLWITGGAAIVAMGALAWLMLPYYEMSKYLGLRQYEEVRWFIPVILSYLYAHESSYAWNILSEHARPDVANWWIHCTFPGIIPLLGLFTLPFMWIYWKIRRVQISHLTWAMTITAFIIFMFFIRTYDGQSFFAWLFKFPGMNSMRVVNRFMHVELFLILVGLVTLALRMPKKWSIILFVLVFLDNSFVADRVIRTSKNEITSRREMTIASIKKELKPGYEAFAIVGGDEPFFVTHLDAMNASNYVDLPTVNGYSSGCPGEFGVFFTTKERPGLNSWLEFSGIDSTKVLVIQR